jgi:sugar phosphate isomerase/epimerase
MSELAVSSWSLHRRLGPTYPGLDLQPGARASELPFGQGAISLLDLPAEAAGRGILLLEICHFHFPSTDTAYLRLLRSRLDAVGVVPLTLLIDDGDITEEDADERLQVLSLIEGWIDVASELGARQARVIAGYAQPGDEAVRRSSAALASLSEYGRQRGVRVITENWISLSMHPDSLLEILNRTGDAVGLCADFGNYKGEDKYDQLRRILPRATSIHAKADFPRAGELDSADFTRCLVLSREAGFDGPYVLIFDNDGDEWQGVEQVAAAVRPYLGSPVTG